MVVAASSIDDVRLCGASWTAAPQAPPSTGFSRQEYQVGCHFLLQGVFPTQGPTSVLCLLPWQAGSLPPLSGKPGHQTGEPCVGSTVLAREPPGKSQYSPDLNDLVWKTQDALEPPGKGDFWHRKGNNLRPQRRGLIANSGCLRGNLSLPSSALLLSSIVVFPSLVDGLTAHSFAKPLGVIPSCSMFLLPYNQVLLNLSYAFC